MRKFNCYLAIFTAIILFFSSITAVSTSAAVTKDVMFGKVKVVKGMVGKISILKDSSIQKKDNKGKVVTVQKAKKGQEFGVYSKGNGFYQLGEGKFVKHTNAIKYTVIPKSLLEQVTKDSSKTEKESKPDIDVSKLDAIGKEYYQFGTAFAKEYGFKLTYVGTGEYKGGKVGFMDFKRSSDNSLIMYWAKNFITETAKDGTVSFNDRYIISSMLLTTEKEIDALISLASYKTGDINKEILKGHVKNLFADDSYKVDYFDAGWKISIYRGKQYKDKAYLITFEPEKFFMKK
jgi:hypothetical protein